MRNRVIILSALALSGCTTVTALGDTFEGQADYAIVPAEYPKKTTGTQPIELSTYSRFQTHPDKRHEGHFENGDNILVSMRTGTIGWFSEGAEQKLINRFAGIFGASELKGEIAVVANVTEGARQPGSRKEDGSLEGRVVFYSDDVYRNQRLNEFNVPIFGPSRYSGGPLTIDLWLLELDRAESDQMGAVLSTLASLSRSVPAMNLPGVDLLSRIGTSFLKANQDDVVGHFTVTLVPPQPGASTIDPILSVSDIIVRRSDKRTTEASFEDCMYSPTMGTLTKCSSKDHAFDNYLILALRKSASSTNIASDVDLNAFNARLKKAAGPAAVAEAYNEVVDSMVSASAYDKSADHISRLKDKTAATASRQFEADRLVASLQCALLAQESGTDEVMADVCGERARARQMSMEDFDRIARKLIASSCVTGAMLSKEGLIPEQTQASVNQARGNLVKTIVATEPCPTG